MLLELVKCIWAAAFAYSIGYLAGTVADPEHGGPYLAPILATGAFAATSIVYASGF